MVSSNYEDSPTNTVLIYNHCPVDPELARMSLDDLGEFGTLVFVEKVPVIPLTLFGTIVNGSTLGAQF